jgi:helicase
MKSLSVKEQSNDAVINVILDTLDKNKQALVFVNTKRSAEKVAEDVSRFLKKRINTNLELSNEILHALPKPTYQCERLAEIIKQQVAFHHAGLTSKQKELIEDNFRTGDVKIICCTPTLAAGVDLPAYRTIIRDVKRFGVRGYTYIPVLEYLQMAGRAGRPKYDTEGESIVIVSTESEKEAITEKYVDGSPEDIVSKLAVEPVLRTYVLSLIASEVVSSREQLIEFFSKTFWAYQFEDMKKIEKIVDKMIMLLEDFEFIEVKTGKKSDFMSADELSKSNNSKISATELGKKVAQLYIDPLTANNFIAAVKRSSGKPSSIALLQLISYTLEMRPLLTVKQREYESYYVKVEELAKELISAEPNSFDEDYDEYVASLKTATFFDEWMQEKDDNYLLETFDVRLETADWLLYSCQELSKLIEKPSFSREVYKIRLRLKYGVKEELLPLLQLQGIGRVRARKLFSNNIKDLGGVKKADIGTLKTLLGDAVAKSIKEQVGEKTDLIVPENKRKGQMSMDKYKE